MTPAAPTSDERERLAALERYQMLDTPAEAEFDDLTSLAAQICGTPIALISLVDAHRQWFKSKVGLEAAETSREISFCAHAIHGPHLLEVPNTQEEFLFYDNPLVTGPPEIRFYAGMPLATPDGRKLGTLCVMDRVPRYLTQVQRDALGRLGRQVMNQMELRLTNRQLSVARQALHDLTEQSHLVLESAPDAMLLVNEGLISLVNSTAERLFGYSRDELIGQPLEMLVAHHSRTARRNNGACDFSTSALSAMKKGRSLTGRRKNGTEMPIEIGLKPLPASEGRLVLASIVSVTARKRNGNQIKQLKRDLKKKRNELARARRELTDLTATLSQDLKAPLRGIGSLANWLVTSYANRLDGSGREQLNLLALKLRRLNALLDGGSITATASRDSEAETTVAFNVARIPSSEKASATLRSSVPTRNPFGRSSASDLEPNEQLNQVVAAA